MADALLREYESIRKHNRNFPKLLKPLTPLKKAIAIMILEKHGVSVEKHQKVSVENSDQVVATLTITRGDTSDIIIANDAIAMARRTVANNTKPNPDAFYIGGDAEVTYKSVLVNANDALKLTFINRDNNKKNNYAENTSIIAAAVKATSDLYIILHNKTILTNRLKQIIYPENHTVIFKYESILKSNEIGALKSTANLPNSESHVDAFQHAIMSYALFAKAQLLGHNENNSHITDVQEYSDYKSTTFEQLVEIIDARKSSEDGEENKKAHTQSPHQNTIANFYIAIDNWKHAQPVVASATDAPVADADADAPVADAPVADADAPVADAEGQTTDAQGGAGVKPSSEFTAVKTSITEIKSILNLPDVVEETTDNPSKNQFVDHIKIVDTYVDDICKHYQIMYSILTSALDSNIKLLDQLSTELMVKAQPDPTVTVKLGSADDTPITLNMLIA
jgi:hypothetical protein